MIRKQNPLRIDVHGKRAHAGPVRLDRRGWLHAALAVMGAISLGRLTRHGRAVDGTAIETWLQQAGFAALGGRAALANAGARYLAVHPQERNRALLVRRLAGGGTLPAAQALAAAIARDWRDHDVTVIDGWVMARAEARICALAHLCGAARA